MTKQDIALQIQRAINRGIEGEENGLEIGSDHEDWAQEVGVVRNGSFAIEMSDGLIFRVTVERAGVL